DGGLGLAGRVSRRRQIHLTRQEAIGILLASHRLTLALRACLFLMMAVLRSPNGVFNTTPPSRRPGLRREIQAQQIPGRLLSVSNQILNTMLVFGLVTRTVGAIIPIGRRSPPHQAF